MRLIDQQSIEKIAIGAGILGTGGGGDPYHGKLMAIQAIQENGPIRLLPIDELDDHDLVAAISVMGAPTVTHEKLPAGTEIFAAIEQMEKELQQKISAVMPIEIGGANSMIPLIAAAYKNIPVVDADAMGRAFPELQMVSFYLDDLHSSPTTLADEKGNQVVLYPQNGKWAERFARVITMQMGGTATKCSYPLLARQVKKSAILGTITLAEQIGAVIRKSKRSQNHWLEQILTKLGGYELFQGKIEDVQRYTDGGFVRGEARLTGIDIYHGKRMKIAFQNEFLIAFEDGTSVATTPDLISILDYETGSPIMTEGLRYGLRVSIIGFPCHPKWRTAKGIATVGPRYFGYDLDYVPIEQALKEGGS